MSERQTIFRADSTNHHTQSDPNSQFDSLFGESSVAIDLEMKNVNLFKSPIRTPLMANTPILQPN